ncbi:unnamed protein product, partial [Mesorhabditis spiculigera]
MQQSVKIVPLFENGRSTLDIQKHRERLHNIVSLAERILAMNLQYEEANGTLFKYTIERSYFADEFDLPQPDDTNLAEFYKAASQKIMFTSHDGYILFFVAPRRYCVTYQNMSIIAMPWLNDLSVIPLSELLQSDCTKRPLPGFRSLSITVLATLHEIMHMFLIPHSNSGLMSAGCVCDSIRNYFCRRPACGCYTDSNRLDPLSLELVKRSSFLTKKDSTVDVRQNPDKTYEISSNDKIDYLVTVTLDNSMIRDVVQPNSNRYILKKKPDKCSLIVATTVCLKQIRF